VINKNQNGSVTPGGVGKCARLSEIEDMKAPKRDFPPKAPAPMLEGKNHLQDKERKKHELIKFPVDENSKDQYYGELYS
jgi:hypothetical protein